MNKVIDDFIFMASVDKATVISERIKIILQPKPTWLPKFLYDKIVARLLVVETQTFIGTDYGS